jgi:hypothetical protein
MNKTALLLIVGLVAFFSLADIQAANALTTVILINPNNQVLEDDAIDASDPFNNRGAEDAFYVQMGTGSKFSSLIKFNISNMSLTTVDSASLCAYVWDLSALTIDAYHIFNNQTWNEETMTFSGFMIPSTGQMNLTSQNQKIPASNNAYTCWDVTNGVKRDASAGKVNSSFYLNSTQTGATKYAYFRSKEYASNRPYLNVTYNETVASYVPSIFILTPSNASYTNSSTVRFTFNVTDKDSNPVAVKGYIDGTLYYDAGSYTSGSVDYFDQSVNDGNHNFTIWASDGANVNTTSLFFKTDLTAPIVTIALPATTNVLAYSTGRLVSINFSATDATGVASCWYSLNGASNVSFAACANSTINASSIGTYSISIYANDSYNHTGNASRSFTVDFINQFWVNNVHAPATYYNFTGYISNATATVANNSAGTPPFMSILTSALPHGVNVTFNASGSGYNNTLVNIGTVDNSTFLNYTQLVYPATLEIFYVYDEYTLAPICYNVYVSNLTFAYNSSSCGISDIPYTSLPVGVVTVSLSNASYITRNYYVTVNPSSYNVLTGWLLPSTLGSYITTFVYSDANPSGIGGAITSAERFLNGSWVTIEQKETDSQGKGYFFLYSWAQHRIRAEYGSLTTLIPSYYPNPSFILSIKLNGTYAVTSPTWLFDTVVVNVTPSSGYVSNVTRFRLFISSPDGDLSKYWLEVAKYKGMNKTVVYSNAVLGSPSGGEIWVDVNITSYINPNKTADRFVATVGFDRVGYDQWNGTISYIPLDLNVGYLPDFLNAFTTGGLGITDPTAIYLIVTIVALVAGGAIAKVDNFGQGGSIGGSFVYIGILALSAVYGLYDWGMLVLMVLAAIGINLARSYL